MSQAVDGLDKANLLEIIDHHRLGGIVTANPLFVRMQPVGCTATILYNVAVENGLTLPKEIAGLLFSAISSDTLYFKSPTTTEKDKEAAGALAKIAEIADPQAYALEMLQAGSAINSMSAEEICHGDNEGIRLPSGESHCGPGERDERGSCQSQMAGTPESPPGHGGRRRSGHHPAVVTDIMDEVTELLWAGKNKDILDKAFGKAEADGHYHLPKVLSRKKQIVPPLTDAFKG